MAGEKDIKMEDTSVDDNKKVETDTAESQNEKAINEEVEQIFAEDENKENHNNQETNDSIQHDNETVEAELKSKIEQLEKELEEKENRLLRVQADFDNYRRRTKGDIEAIEKYRSQSLATELLTVVDNFERALQTEVKSDDAKALLQGMEMVYKGMLEAFKKEGIEPIDSVGKEFDPHEHHAVMQGSDDQVESNIVLEEFQKGYRLKDRVIRPAMVKVNQ